jgi:glutathione peroxidase
MSRGRTGFVFALAAALILLPAFTAAPTPAQEDGAESLAFTFVPMKVKDARTVETTVTQHQKMTETAYSYATRKDEVVREVDQKVEVVTKTVGAVVAVDDAGLPNAMLLHFAKGSRSRTLGDGEPETERDPWVGSSFRVFLRGERAYVLGGTGGPAPLQAQQPVVSEFNGYRNERMLKPVLDGKTVKVGQTIEVPEEIAKGAFGGAVKSFKLTMTEIRTVRGRKCGVFAMAVTFDAEQDGTRLTGSWKGEYVISGAEGWTHSFELGGTQTQKGSRQSPQGAAIKINASTTTSRKIVVTYHDEVPEMPGAKWYDPANPSDKPETDEGDEGDDPDVGGSEFYNITVKNLAGEDVKLSKYKGKVVVIVNVASRCGFTPQYKGLQALYEEFRDKGLAILAFPSNDFNQEPGDAAQIREFCEENYGVTFDLMAKVPVKAGDEQHPLFKYLAGETGKSPGWNFWKYVVDADGTVVRAFSSVSTPERRVRDLVADLLDAE